MFERYTEKARRVIFFARYEAAQFGAQAIESEHILLGLLREDAKLFESVGQPQIAQAIRDGIAPSVLQREPLAGSIDLPLSPSGERVLTLADVESEKLGHRHIGTEHLLLGLLLNGSFASEVLQEFGLTAESVTKAIKAGGANELRSPLGKRAQQFTRLVEALVAKGAIEQDEFTAMQFAPPYSLSELSARLNLLSILLKKKGVISEADAQEIGGAPGRESPETE